MIPLAALLLVQPGAGWAQYGGDPGGQRFASSAQISAENVASLRRVWKFDTGDVSDKEGKPTSAFECTPILIGRSLIFSTPFNRVFAIDATSGQQQWVYDPKIPKSFSEGANLMYISRGVSSWTDAAGKSTIFLASYDARLIAIQAGNGKLQTSFGQNGTVSLQSGIKNYKKSEYSVTSPPAVIGRTVVVGSCILDDRRVTMAQGTVRAYDAVTGMQKWAWLPSPTFGAGNAWAPISADAKRNLVFIPTSSLSPDYYGGLRKGNNEWANSVVAVDADTGKVKWGFQAVRHDLWNFDIPAQPILTTVNGRDVVVVLTKMGFVFVLDRDTGKPVLPVEYRAVPKSTVTGEVAAATQPFPVMPKPLLPELTPAGAWGPDATGLEDAKRLLTQFKPVPIFTPPSLRPQTMSPGVLGGMNWSGGAVDPGRGTLVVNINNFPNAIQLVPRSQVDAFRRSNPGMTRQLQEGTPYAAFQKTLTTRQGLPPVAPPWGELVAIDLSTGELKWRKPLGWIPRASKFPGYKEWGSPSLGGAIVTGSGLVFIAGTQDGYLRAFDIASGAEIWSDALPAGGNASPMSYEIDGKQFVVICAGGHGGFSLIQGSSVVAYALP